MNLLKLRELAKGFHQKLIKNGKDTSFWHDNWSKQGVLFDVLGNRDYIDLGIARTATMEEVMNSHRSRRHRVAKLNHIEAEISSTREARKIDEEDVHLWKWITGFKKSFSTCETWMLIREERPKCDWAKGVWFPHRNMLSSHGSLCIIV